MHVSKGCEIRKQLSVSPGSCNPVSSIFWSRECSRKDALSGRMPSPWKNMDGVDIEVKDSPTYPVSG